MSSNQSDPINNPTQITTLPKQMMAVKPAARIMDYTKYSINQPMGFNTNQMDWIAIAKKNKFVKELTWEVDSNNDWIYLELTPHKILQYAQVAKDFQLFFNVNAILITIQPTNNTFMQGLTKVTFDPAPVDYYKNVLGNQTAAISKHAFQQFETFEISPKTSDTYNMIIPVNIPFPYMTTSYIGHGFVNSEIFNIFEYIATYPLGVIRSKVYAPLETKSPITQLRYNMSIQLLDLKTDGMVYEKIPK